MVFISSRIKRSMFAIFFISIIILVANHYSLSNHSNSMLNHVTSFKASKPKSDGVFMEMFERAREKIDVQFDDFPNMSLERLVPEEDGQPIRCLIVSTWAAGGNLLATMLNAMPGSYYHYEPLSYLGLRRLRQGETSSSSEIEAAIQLLQDLLDCKYSKHGTMKTYLKAVEDDRNIFQYNTRLWELCESSWNFCKSVPKLNAYCRVFPIQLMKTNRLPLAYAKTLLQRYSYVSEALYGHGYPAKLKVIYMLRDPRGIIYSREQWARCVLSPEHCGDTLRLCADMVDDYVAAQELKRDFAADFMVVNYEKLVLDIQSELYTVLKFLNLPYSYYMQNNIAKQFILRKKQQKKQLWEKHWSQSNKASVEQYCQEALEKWGFERSVLNVTFSNVTKHCDD